MPPFRLLPLLGAAAGLAVALPQPLSAQSQAPVVAPNGLRTYPTLPADYFQRGAAPSQPAAPTARSWSAPSSAVPSAGPAMPPPRAAPVARVVAEPATAYPVAVQPMPAQPQAMPGGTQVVSAADPIPETMEEWKILLGGALAVEPIYEGADSVTLNPWPILDVSWRGQAFLNDRHGLGYNLVNTDFFKAGPLVGYYRGRPSEEEASGMEELTSGLKAGVFGQYVHQNLKVTGKFEKPLTGDGAGYLLSAEGSYGAQILPRLKAVGSLGTTYATDAYMKAFYSVTPTEAAVTRLREFTAAGGIKDVNGDVRAIYDLNENWRVVGDLGARMMLGDAADSPLVKDVGNELQFWGRIGLGYEF